MIVKSKTEKEMLSLIKIRVEILGRKIRERKTLTKEKERIKERIKEKPYNGSDRLTFDVNNLITKSVSMNVIKFLCDKCRKFLF